uniref:NADH-ubiquinone oxidoreductase chain 6 n=1 Tax=Eunapius subterraneus TaxID=681720 RepID=G8Z436_9METZ|nr:NADH dehydrogenase subunit 6 [Eunapius subterraneus]ACY35557.1 NADH dehydrogenase subunit 6 [Eunapius subterraneus]
MEGLFYLFTLGVIISGIMVISALNPVHSVLWLIVAFTSASALFILLEVEFIALIFLIVYVGAIAILFLFVIMMLNLTDLEGGGDMSNYLPAGFLIGVVFLLEIAHVMGGRMVSWPHSTSYPAQLAILLGNPNVEVLGRVLYTDYYYLFIIASFILLVAMIGAIVLTHDSKTEIKRQDIFIQTSRQLWQD